MQFATLVAQPTSAPPPSAPSPFLRMTSILRGTPLPSAAAAAPAASDAAPTVTSATLPASTPMSDAGLAATIASSVASRQERYLANQQLLGAISAGLGARLSHVGAQTWALLRGTAPDVEGK